MYNPCRGGVRGGADQFTWESVKTDKHRENYLGHSLKAPVGRWQKGKDLSWYAKERKNGDESEKTELSEMAAIKRAEEEAMLIALGHKVIRKESQPVLSKDEITEALKRNVGDRDNHNVERIDGVGSSSRRTALMTSANKDQSRSEGVLFERHRERKADLEDDKEESPLHKRSKAKKKSKKRKKEKKAKHSPDASDSDESAPRKLKRHKRDYDSHRDSSLLATREKHKRPKHRHQSPNSSGSDHHRFSKRRVNNHKPHYTPPRRRHRHDTSESD